jgi:peptide deformylase
MDPTQLAVDLAETMIDSKGIGLAANQIGLPYRVFALNGDPVNVIFNPRLITLTE